MSLSSFNPRVRGTCLVRPVMKMSDRAESLKLGFNPRVRGTCLVRDPPSKDRL